jgi:hypothetical protein
MTIETRVNGKAGRIAHLQKPADDLVLITVWDVSSDLAFVELAKTAFTERLRELPKNIYVAVLRANEGMQVALDPTGDRDAVADALTHLPVGGKSAFLDTIATASEIADSMAARTGVRSAVLYLTDSDVARYREDFTNPVINSSDSRDLSRRFPEGLIREKISKVADSLAPLQAPVFFVHLAYRTDRLNEAYQTGMIQLAVGSGGAGWFCRSPAEITESVVRMIDSAVNQYVAWVQTPPKVSRTVFVELTAPDQALTYRTRYAVK